MLVGAPIEAMEASGGRQSVFTNWHERLFILTAGTAVPVHPGYMPSLAACMAAANPTKFLRQALQSITHNRPKVAFSIIFLVQMTKQTWEAGG